MNRVGAVAIGRNEGDRLRLCLESLVGRCAAAVYVDSGSADGSVSLARSMGVEVVELDPSTPFTAGRARNAGFARLMEICPDLPVVQFVDGDCELAEGWLGRAACELEGRPDVAVVCGRVRERHPERSIYNRLADLEWDAPHGEVRACGGIFAVRSEAFRMVDGFDPGIIAAEDDECCLRLLRARWKIIRIDAPMATHDMSMTRFGQWWRRSVRTGYAYADGVARHGRGPERHFVREVRGVLLWGISLPVAAIAAAWATGGLSILLAAALYLWLVFRIYARMRRRGKDASRAGAYASFCLIGKFPQAVGLACYAIRRIAGGGPRIIEHKGPDTSTARHAHRAEPVACGPTGERSDR